MVAHMQTDSIHPHATRMSTTRPTLNFISIGSTRLCLCLGVQSTTSRELKVVETASELLDTALPDTPADEEMGMPSLLHGFEESLPHSTNHGH
jgi:hypothetical protein